MCFFALIGAEFYLCSKNKDYEKRFMDIVIMLSCTAIGAQNEKENGEKAKSVVMKEVTVEAARVTKKG